MKRKSGKVNRAWLNEHLTDPYVKLARKEGYRARAAYKLKEIDETLHLLRPDQFVVDLGAAPGAWSQYVRRRQTDAGRAGVGTAAATKSQVSGGAAGESGQAASPGAIVALDLLPFEPIEGVQVLQGDFREAEVLAQLEMLVGKRPVDVVLSDMAPNLSGIESSDTARIADLIELAVDFALAHLRPEGVLVAKAFHGSGYSQLVELFKRSFRTVKPLKPKASRSRSAETFLVGIGPKSGRVRAASAAPVAHPVTLPDDDDPTTARDEPESKT